jgi:hypothetical protein
MKKWLKPALKSTGALLSDPSRGSQHPRRFFQLSVDLCHTACKAATFTQALVETVARATAGKQ